METKNAPLPWTRNRFEEITAADRKRVTVNGFALAGTATHAQANANDDLILRAVNSHEQLVAALKYAKMRLELADEDRFDKTTLQQINEALAAAGEV